MTLGCVFGVCDLNANLLTTGLVELCETRFHCVFAATSAVDEAELRFRCREPIPRSQAINFEDQLWDRVDACSMHSSDSVINRGCGYNFTIKDTIGIDHVQTSELGALEQQLSAIQADGANLCILTHEPPPRQCYPHQLAFLIALSGCILGKTVRLHSGGGDSVVGYFFVARTQARLCSKFVKEFPLGVPVVWELGLGHCKIVSICRQTILSFICFYLLLVTTQEERTTRIFDIESDSFPVEISKGAEQIALCRPPMGSAKI